MPPRPTAQRGVGVAFGPDVAQRWLAANGLQMVVRSHEVKEEGYEVAHGGYTVTIFSAPNYCDQMVRRLGGVAGGACVEVCSLLNGGSGVSRASEHTAPPARPRTTGQQGRLHPLRLGLHARVHAV